MFQSEGGNLNTMLMPVLFEKWSIGSYTEREDMILHALSK
jgi:hypothetical protein